MTELNQRIRGLEIPNRMKHLKISDEGYPVPWFVPWIDGKPEFRGMDGEKFGIACRHYRCWLCGETLGKFLCFAIGPMCMVNRINSEPPSHYDCARFSVEACPFLSQPRMRRNEKDMPEGGTVAGIMIKRNPGVTVLWTTLHYKLFRDPNKKVLFSLGDPVGLEFYTEGRRAKKEEILASIDSGLPELRKVEKSKAAQNEIDKAYQRALKLIPEDPPI